MPQTSKLGYYAVRVGRVPGIYSSWAECENQVKGFTGALYKKLSTEAEANAFLAATPSSASRDVVPFVSTSRSPVVSDPTTPKRTIQALRSTPRDEKDCDIVYCDGACKGNGQPGSIAGVGVWWGHGDIRNISERCPGDQTNNRAELIAIVRVLETTPRLKRRLLIKTDSHYSIQCVSSWIFKWVRNGFLAADGKPVKNRALIKYLAALLHVRRKTSQTVEFKHVRGHAGIEGNEAADRLANLGTTKPIIPERNWERLEKEALQALEPIKLSQVVDDDLKAYADGLLSDDELAEWADMSFTDVTFPVQEPRGHSGSGKNAIASQASASVVPHEVSPPRINAAGSAVAQSSGETTAVHSWSRLSSTNASGRTLVSTLLQAAPSEKPVPAVSREEVEALASCLLSDDELSVLGKDGEIDSDL